MSIRKEKVTIASTVATMIALVLVIGMVVIVVVPNSHTFDVVRGGSILLKSLSFASASADSSPATTTIANNSTSHLLPVLLVHGWNEDASIWGKWEELLKKDGIPFYPITFQKSDDKCGAALSHATELGEQIQTIEKQTGTDKVNIVAHSKGGIDARVYLANGTKNVSNLVMLGTPNAGSPLADYTTICMPATLDLRPGSDATKVQMNPNVKYYTIAGDWLHDLGGNPAIPGLDDGLSPVSSVESEKNFQSLGRTSHSHLELLGEQEYNMARNVLLGK